MVGIKRSLTADNIQEEIYDRYLKNEINVTLRNGQKMKCDLKGSVNMNLKGGKWSSRPKFYT